LHASRETREKEDIKGYPGRLKKVPMTEILYGNELLWDFLPNLSCQNLVNFDLLF
jgi:hypothetical protein